MLRTLGWVIWLFAYLLGRMPLYIRIKQYEKQGRTEEKDALINREIKKWATKLLHHVKMKVHVEGQENLPPPGEAVVFAANHQSYLDIPVMLGMIDPPCPLLAREGLGKIPLLSFWMKKIGCIFVKREDARAAASALKDAEEMVAGGKSLTIFPEGTRAKSSQLGDFKAGVVRVAWKAGARIVPVAIEGTYKCLEGNGYKIQPTDVRLVILPPVETKDLDRAGQKALPKQLEEMIRQAKDGQPKALENLEGPPAAIGAKGAG